MESVDMLFIGLLILLFGLAISNIILANKDTNIQNTTLECNEDKIISNIHSLSDELESNKDWLSAKIDLKKTNCNPTYYLELPEDRDKLYMTLSYVASAREYELDKYDCTEKAGLLVELLKEQGFNKVKTKFVNIDCNNWGYGDDYTYEDCKSNNGGHLIVDLDGIYIEATSGRFIMPEDYDKYGL